MQQFTDLGLERPILDALATANYTQPTPIQGLAIPPVLAGRDLLGIAATGTGKTAAFALPILQRLAADSSAPVRGSCRALILAPTRELVAQIADSFRAYGRNHKLRMAVIVGGVSHRPQLRDLNRGVDIIIATPGRLLDHIQQGNARLDRTGILVLDEADHMLDLGFIPAIRKLVAGMPKQRQTLLFSATMPREIRALADDFLHEPETVAATPAATPAERIDQRLIHVDNARKGSILTDILGDGEPGRVLVFTRTKRGADRVVRNLETAGVNAVAIHGNKSQSQRQRALSGFKSGRAPVLVATDIAARGIDVDGIKLVVNYDMPTVPETYVHRIGRTARAGAEGRAVSLCTRDERPQLAAIEKLIKCRIPGSSDATAPGDDGVSEGKPKQRGRNGRREAPRDRPRQQQKAAAGPAKRSGENRRQPAPQRDANPDQSGHPLGGMDFLRRRDAHDDVEAAGNKETAGAPRRGQRRPRRKSANRKLQAVQA